QGDELLELVGGHGVVLEGEAAEVGGRSAGAEPLGGHVVGNGPGAAAEVVVDLGAGEEDAAAADAGDELVAADGVLNESGGVSGVGVDVVLVATADGMVPAVLAAGGDTGVEGVELGQTEYGVNLGLGHRTDASCDHHGKKALHGILS